jgi:hypothetical protein
VNKQFAAPKFAADVDALRDHINDIMAGNPWPADLDYSSFIFLSSSCLAGRRNGDRKVIAKELIFAMCDDANNGLFGP